jgi:hypothetical protein
VCETKQVPQQSQRTVDRRSGERARDGSLAFTDLPHGREPVSFVFGGAAGRDLSRRRLVPEVVLEAPEDAPVLGH